MSREGLLERLSRTSAAAQASVPGIYAWAVTVAPTAWARGARPIAKIASMVALLLLASSVLRERPRSLGVGAVRGASFWGFVVASAVVWAAAPQGLSSLRVDTPRGLAGMLAWALFAFASATPVVSTRLEEPEHPADQPPLAPRHRLPRGDLAYVAAGGLLAAVLQVEGWRIVSPERALLQRLVALAAGLALIGAMTQVGLLRHTLRGPRAPAGRLRRALPTLVVLGILMVSGLLLFVFD
jgi:hypothetical protein